MKEWTKEAGREKNARRHRRRAFVASMDRGPARLRGLQIARSLLAPLGHDVVADLLAFHEGAHAGTLDRADVHEHVLAAVARLDESKASLSIEELHGTCGHHGLLAFRCINPITRASRVRSSNFWGAGWAP